jgi:hypothetical protein
MRCTCCVRDWVKSEYLVFKKRIMKRGSLAVSRRIQCNLTSRLFAISVRFRSVFRYKNLIPFRAPRTLSPATPRRRSEPRSDPDRPDADGTYCYSRGRGQIWDKSLKIMRQKLRYDLCSEDICHLLVQYYTTNNLCTRSPPLPPWMLTVTPCRMPRMPLAGRPRKCLNQRQKSPRRERLTLRWNRRGPSSPPGAPRAHPGSAYPRSYSATNYAMHGVVHWRSAPGPRPDPPCSSAALPRSCSRRQPVLVLLPVLQWVLLCVPGLSYRPDSLPTPRPKAQARPPTS